MRNKSRQPGARRTRSGRGLLLKLPLAGMPARPPIPGPPPRSTAGCRPPSATDRHHTATPTDPPASPGRRLDTGCSQPPTDAGDVKPEWSPSGRRQHPHLPQCARDPGGDGRPSGLRQLPTVLAAFVLPPGSRFSGLRRPAGKPGLVGAVPSDGVVGGCLFATNVRARPPEQNASISDARMRSRPGLAHTGSSARPRNRSHGRGSRRGRESPSGGHVALDRAPCSI